MKIFRTIATYVAAITGLVGILVVLFAFDLPPFTDGVETTNDAYVRGQVTFVAPQLAGYVADVPVSDYQEVEKGEVILRIDDRIYSQKLAQAKATLDARKADLANSAQDRRSAEARIEAAEATLESARAALGSAEATWTRTNSLQQKGIATASDRDKARAGYDQARAAVHEAEAALEVAKQDLSAVTVNRESLKAAVEGAEAAVELAEIDVANTEVRAPRAGQLGTVDVQLGQYVTAGTRVTALVPDQLWVVANFKETQLPGMHLGQEVELHVDALGDAALTGHIERFSPAMGSEFSILKPDNATGNFTKIAQRLPIRIAIDEGQPLAEKLRPGMSVVADIDVAREAGTARASPEGTLPFGTR